MSQYRVSRDDPPYRTPRHPPGQPCFGPSCCARPGSARNPYRAEVIYRGHRIIGTRPERRHTLSRRLRAAWLRYGRQLRDHYWQAFAAGGLEL